MANHLLFVPFLLNAEGGLSKDPNDSSSKNPVPDGSGYHTNKGVTWRTFQAWAKTLGYTATPALFYEMPTRIWASIFKQGYWDKVGGDHIEAQAVADILADWAYNGGYTVKWVQQALVSLGHKIAVDGKLGPATVAALNTADGNKFYALIRAERSRYYHALASKSEKQKKNLPGWMARLVRLDSFEKKKQQLPVPAPVLVDSSLPAPSSGSSSPTAKSSVTVELAAEDAAIVASCIPGILFTSVAADDVPAFRRLEQALRDSTARAELAHVATPGAGR